MTIPYNPYEDPVLQALIAEATADPDVLGLILSGSLGAGAFHPESDYDVVFVVTKEAIDRYTAEDRWPERGASAQTTKTKDLWHVSLDDFTPNTMDVWEIPSYSHSMVLLDKTGDVTRLIQPFWRKPKERARAEVAADYDGYLNMLYRSLKAWRRGNDLGGRMSAAQSAWHLLDVLFGLERHWRPYHDRLWLHMEVLAGQGWGPGELRALLLDLLTHGNPVQQQEIARRVEALLRERGFGHVYDDWNGEIDEVLAWRFPDFEVKPDAANRSED